MIVSARSRAMNFSDILSALRCQHRLNRFTRKFLRKLLLPFFPSFSPFLSACSISLARIVLSSNPFFFLFFPPEFIIRTFHCFRWYFQFFLFLTFLVIGFLDRIFRVPPIFFSTSFSSVIFLFFFFFFSILNTRSPLRHAYLHNDTRAI